MKKAKCVTLDEAVTAKIKQMAIEDSRTFSAMVEHVLMQFIAKKAK